VRAALVYQWTGETWVVPSVGMEFVWIWRMRMWVGKYEVTNGEYRKKEPRHITGPFGKHEQNRDRQPVMYVNWDNACAYAKWLTERERAAGRLPEDMRYRLPTEDEFMKYAQCGTRREFPWGKDWPPKSGKAGNYLGAEAGVDRTFADALKFADYRDGHIVSCDVEESWANPWGLYGVGGNAYECCAADTKPKQAFGDWRGGCWYFSARSYLTCAAGISGTASSRGYYNGFRLVLAR